MSAIQSNISSSKLAEQLLIRLFESLEEKGIKYCVLHGYETLPDFVPSDVDIAIDHQQKDNLDSILYQLASETGFIITQKLYYDIPNCYYYVLVHSSENDIAIVQLDFLIDNIGINRYLLKSSELLEGRKRYKNFYVPDTSIEAVYFLIKKIVKGKFYKEHQLRLKELYFEDTKSVEKKFIHYFGKDNIHDIEQLIMNEEIISETIIKKLRHKVIKKHFTLSKYIQKFYWLAKRGLFRVNHPTGMFVVILSPDGGGKTSVAKGILQVLRQSFRRTRYLYWRPGILPEIRDLIRLRFKNMEERTNPNPHGNKERGRLISYVRFFYYTFDFLLGYLKIRFLKTITTLVVMDRYYYDFLIDKKRYGFNIPDWLPELLSKIIPKPDLIIYLDNESDAIYERKKELPIEELKRQIEEFRELVSKMPNAYTVNTKKALNNVILEAARIVIKTKAEHLKRLLGVA